MHFYSIHVRSSFLEETPTCRKKTVAWTNEMIEDLIDFIEIHPIVAFEARGFLAILVARWVCVVQ
jgi:hypothetical protein